MTLALVEAVIVFLVVSFHSTGGAFVLPESGVVLARAVAVSVCWFLAFHFNDLYDLRVVRGLGVFTARLPKALVLLGLFLAPVILGVPPLRIGWRPLATTLAVALVLILPLRAAFHRLLGSHPFTRRVLVLGTTPLAGKLVVEILNEPDLRDVVLGIADDGSAAFKPVFPCLRLGPIDRLAEILEEFRPDWIVVALAERRGRLPVRELLGSRVRGIPVEDGTAVYERLTGKVAIESASPSALVFSKDFEASWAARAVGRAASAVVSLLALLLLAPLLIPVALLIKLDSRGPVFFLHERAGLRGRPFQLVKLRTMRPGGAVSEWARDNGHRTTRVGYWLRRFRLDELPQLWNVLVGDMNLVGPRPHPVSNVELFLARIPYYGLRATVRPGITGWAQIRYGYANDLEEETEKMRYDLHYIKHMSLGLDLRILFETAKAVFRERPSTAPVRERRGVARQRPAASESGALARSRSVA